jgi:hypothetical protein
MMDAKEYTTTNILKLKAEIARLRAALEEIVATERDDDSICAADRCAEIARKALAR